jgi:site-specific recombinase XerD
MNMYAMKHLGANKKILAGLDIDSLRELYGHSSKLMTEKYATVIKELHRKEILDKSPDF